MSSEYIFQERINFGAGNTAQLGECLPTMQALNHTWVQSTAAKQ